MMSDTPPLEPEPREPLPSPSEHPPLPPIETETVPPPPANKYAVNAVRAAQWVDEHAINCEVDFSGSGAGHFLPFTARDDDPEPHAQEVWQRVTNGEAGPIAPAAPPAPERAPQITTAAIVEAASDAELEAIEEEVGKLSRRARMRWNLAQRITVDDAEALLLAAVGPRRTAEILKPGRG